MVNGGVHLAWNKGLQAWKIEEKTDVIALNNTQFQSSPKKVFTLGTSYHKILYIHL